MIFDHGARQMFERGEDVFYYLTAANENYPQPSIAVEHTGGIIKGMYCYSRPKDGNTTIRLLGSGAILREVIAAATMLSVDWGVDAEVWSVTSFAELARDARETERENRLRPLAKTRISYVAECLGGAAPIVAATDYVAAYAGIIACFVDAPFTSLGTDGFGRSDTRTALRRFFEVDRHHVVVAALHSLSSSGALSPGKSAAAIDRYGIDRDVQPPWSR